MLSTTNEQQTLNAFISINKMFSRARNNTVISSSFSINMMYFDLCGGCKCVRAPSCHLLLYLVHINCFKSTKFLKEQNDDFIRIKMNARIQCAF